MRNPGENHQRKVLWMLRDIPILPLLMGSFLLAIAFVPHFCTVYNLKNYLLQSADLLIISCGLTFVVLNGGIDFSDALHVARSSRASGFATFDRQLAKRAKGLALAPPVELLI